MNAKLKIECRFQDNSFVPVLTFKAGPKNANLSGKLPNMLFLGANNVPKINGIRLNNPNFENTVEAFLCRD